MKNINGSLESEARSMYAIFTGIASAASVISLIKRAFDVGLAGVFQEYCRWYMKIARLLTDPIDLLAPFKVADWYRDLFVLSFLSALLWRRAVDQVLERAPSSYLDRGVRYARRFAFAFIISVPLLGLIALVTPLFGFFFPQITLRRSPSKDASLLLQRTIKYFLTVVIVATLTSVLFFALNSLL